MEFVNEGRGDRATRIVAGALLLAGGWVLTSGLLGIVVLAVGAVALATGISGWCPAYTVCGVSTRTVVAGACPDCEADRRLERE
jgi:hypothetical protein